MPQMMSRDGFKLWLVSNPTPADVVDHLDYLRYWADQLKNGGDGYVNDIINMAHDYIKKYQH